MNKSSIALILPTYNAMAELPQFFAALNKQTLQPTSILVIDSNSTDRTQEYLKRNHIRTHSINKCDFNHGGTRRLGTELIDADIYIMMTQDAILADVNSLKNLIQALNADPMIGCAYGRQLPKLDANSISAHGRYKNYPNCSIVRTYADRDKYGIKTCFNSDNLAAYRKTALLAIDGFPKNILTAEDAYVAAKLLIQGYKIHYAANATIYHSHNLTLTEEFHRYFSLGVTHQIESWIVEHFKEPTGAGIEFVKSEIDYLCKQKNYFLLSRSIVSILIKYISYKLGRYEKYIPHVIKKEWGINKNYWNTLQHDR